MKGKIALLVGAAAGYVLGTRDGRQRYEQIKSQAQRAWNNPAVQEKAAQAQDLAKDKASQVADKASSKASSSTSGTSSSATASTSSAPDPADATPADMPGATTPAAPQAGADRV